MIILTIAGLSSIYGIERYIENRVENYIEGIVESQQINLLEDTIGILENKVMLESEIVISSPLPESNEMTLGTMQGKGVIVNHENKDYIITAAHVVSLERRLGEEPSESFNVDYRTRLNGEKLDEIIIDAERDIAIFKFPDNLERPEYQVRLGDSENLLPFEKIYILGNPGLSGFNVREGIISNYERTRTVGNVETEGINISANVYPGDSGTPVINENGEILGIVKETHYNLTGYFAPINWFKEYFE